jgi:pilus assembly protein CpaE
MSIYLLNAGGDEEHLDEVESKLRPVIPDLTRVARIEDIGQRSLKSAARSFVILVAASTEKNYFSNLADAVAGYPNFFFVVISGEISARDYKRLVQSGNAEWVAETAYKQEVLEVLGRVGAAAVDERRPVVISFVPSAGGVGNSTLAIETAIHLVDRTLAKDGKIALVDLDFQSSHMCDYLDIAPKLQVDEIIAAPERLDDQLLAVFASQHSSGLEVFAAPRSPLHVRDFSLDALSAMLERMADRYAFIIADMPLSTHTWTLPLLTASDGILVTGVNTIPGLRKVSETLNAIRAENGVNAEVRGVINRCEFGMLGKVARANHIARILHDEKLMFVRNTRVALECVNIGSPISLAYPSDKAVKDVAGIAAYCTAMKPASSRGDGQTRMR